MREVHGGVIGVPGERLEMIISTSGTASRDDVLSMAAEILRRRKEAEESVQEPDEEEGDRDRQVVFHLMRIQDDLWDLTKRVRDGTL